MHSHTSHAVVAARAAPEPVTAEEVEALARRIRVEAKLTRVAVVGTVLGLGCGTAAVLPFLDVRGYMAESLARSELGGWGFVAGWLLAGLLPLLAFYAGRLQLRSGATGTGELETGLRKLRRVILWAMFASMAAFLVALAGRQSNRYETKSWVALTYAGCFAACAFIVRDVRRGLGDFDGEHQRRRRRLARGFAVELWPVGAPHPADDVPLASRAGADAVQPASPGERQAPAGPLGLPVNGMPPGPRAPGPTPVLPVLPATLVDPGEDEHAKDLRLLMSLAVAVAIGIHAVRLGHDLTGVGRHADRIASSVQQMLGPGNPYGSSGSLARVLVLIAGAARVLLAACAIPWLVWGILSLNYGPIWRRGIGWLTVVTLALGLLCVLPGWLYGPGYDRYRYNREEPDVGMLSRAPEIVHALFLGLLLTRPGVRRLFARGSAGDAE